MLNTYHLDELLQKINEEKDNISILIGFCGGPINKESQLKSKNLEHL